MLCYTLKDFIPYTTAGLLIPRGADTLYGRFIVGILILWLTHLLTLDFYGLRHFPTGDNSEDLLYFNNWTFWLENLSDSTFVKVTHTYLTQSCHQ